MKLWLAILLGSIAVIVLAGGWITSESVPHAWWDRIPAFFSFFGFSGCVLIIFLAKGLGRLFLRKREDYYHGH